MMKYSPLENQYKGDVSVGEYTKANKTVREKRKRTTNVVPSNIGDSTFGIAVQENVMSGRLHSGLTTILPHLQSKLYRHNKQRVCFVCGTRTCNACGICTITLRGGDGTMVQDYTPLCSINKTGKTCYYDYHNISFFGLCRDDAKYSGVQKRNWKEPNKCMIDCQAKYIEHCMACTDEGGANYNMVGDNTQTSTSTSTSIGNESVGNSTEENQNEDNMNEDIVNIDVNNDIANISINNNNSCTTNGIVTAI